jgi:hypothetical protein
MHVLGKGELNQRWIMESCPHCGRHATLSFEECEVGLMRANGIVQVWSASFPRRLGR